MQLIGMMDSPYVRRVAIALRRMGLAHEHKQVSVFRHMDEFRTYNPVIKAPTLVCDDGGTIMDSNLILEYLEALAGPAKSLMPRDLAARQKALSVIGIAMAVADKSVAVEYERKRPEAQRYAPWMDRIREQLGTACGLLDKAVPEQDWFFGDTLGQADITTAVAWRFCQFIVPDVIAASAFPRLDAFTKRADMLPEFIATPLE